MTGRAWQLLSLKSQVVGGLLAAARCHVAITDVWLCCGSSQVLNSSSTVELLSRGVALTQFHCTASGDGRICLF